MTDHQVRRIFTAILIMGVSGSGKTTLLSTFAEYLWETYRKILLLYSWDGGAIPTIVQKRMKQGLIRFWRARTRSAEGLAIETVYLATKGYWPRVINPLTGETDPAVQMVAPVSVRYETFCGKGHPLQVVPAPSLIVPTFCAECKQLPAPNEVKYKETVRQTKGFETVGGVAFDSLTSMSGGTILDEMDRQRGAGLISGEKAAFGGVVMSGSMKFGGNNRADIGFAQTRAQQFVNNSLSIPNLVEGPVFTGLTLEATDEGGLSVVGLKLPGRAATDEASSWFGNVMESARVLDDKGKIRFTLYLKPFTDPQGRRHLLKTSASPGAVPAILQDPDEEENHPNANANLGNVFRMLDDDLRKALADTEQGMPGLPEGSQTYGEPFTVEAASAPAPTVNTPAQPIVTTPAPVVTSAPPAQMPPPRSRKAAPSAAAPAVATPPAPPATPAAITTAGPDTPATTAAPPPPGAKPPQRAPGT
jgi:hypothetical protein